MNKSSVKKIKVTQDYIDSLKQEISDVKASNEDYIELYLETRQELDFTLCNIERFVSIIHNNQPEKLFDLLFENEYDKLLLRKDYLKLLGFDKVINSYVDYEIEGDDEI